MPENQIHLTLTTLQQSQYFAHLLVYLFGQAADLSRPRHKATSELVQEVAYRLFHECRQACQERELTLSVEEAQAVKDAFASLHHRYTQWPALDASSFALKDLAACRVSLEQAEQHITRPEESREQ